MSHIVYSKTYTTPRRPFEKERLDSELKLIGEFGLRNKREVWRVKYTLAKIRKAARELLTLEDKDPRRLFEGNAILRRLVRIGVLDENRMKLDYVLGLKTEDFLERRLQTQVFKLGLAKSIHHARVLIRQKHIRVRKQVVNIPSFIVRLDAQKHIDIAINSAYGSGREGRVKSSLARLARGVCQPAAVRALSTSTRAAEGIIKPNVQLYGVNGRYAHALFSAATKSESLGKVEKEIQSFKGLMKTDGGLKAFLDTPVISRTEKSAAIQATLTKQKYSPTVVNFFGAMAENNRLPETTGVIDAFETLMASSRNEVHCTITTAKPLDKKSLASVEKSLKGFATGDQVLSVTAQTDPSIVGGLIVEVGDKYIDMSIVTKIQKISNSLSQAV